MSNGHEGYESLKELALDLRWSWNHSTDKMWAELEPELWELTHNPWVVLQTVSKIKLNKSLADPNFKHTVQALIKGGRDHLNTTTWFQKHHPNSLSCVAYFSMEFMLSEALPIYSGGLGNVAGDQLKTASDLGVPVVGVGLLYSQGYFRQMIDKNGKQQAIFPYNDPGQLPISPLRKSDGEWLRLNIELPGWSVWVRAWEVRIGRAKLYLLDTNDAANFPAHRGITGELYGGNGELRLKQELVLGIGGWRLLKALGLQPEVCHLNEGHAAFAILERAHFFMDETGQPFEIALLATRPGNLFTTHTAVPAGFDKFHPTILKAYLGQYVESHLKIPFKEFLKLGQENQSDNSDNDYFNMAYFAIRGSGVVNGVSSIHSKVSHRLFRSLFLRWPEEEVPIGFVTNGVHMPSWDSPESDDLWTRYCEKSRWLDKTEHLQKKMKKVPDLEIWNMREQNRKSLIDFARHRLSNQLKARGASQEEVDRCKSYLDPRALTLGFARRFAGYKRPNLLLHDPGRLLCLLTDRQRPVQIILAGKAHPADQEGQILIRSWMQFVFDNEGIRQHVVFLSDYDMLLTEYLVQGADVWINTPRRPWEACGTSGMKVLVNGGLNLSELDGWWAEGYSPEVGWAIGNSQDQDYNDPSLDAAEAINLYELLEQKIIPEFYQRNNDGIPVSWIAKIRESMATLTPYYSANRAVREYTERYYIPGAQRYHDRTANNAALCQEILQWKRLVESNWRKVHFGKLTVENNFFEIEVFLGDLTPEAVKVELFAEGSPPIKQEMTMIRQTGDGYLYHTKIDVHHDNEALFTPRITPFHPQVMIPLELPLIQWQK